MQPSNRDSPTNSATSKRKKEVETVDLSMEPDEPATNEPPIKKVNVLPASVQQRLAQMNAKVQAIHNNQPSQGNTRAEPVLRRPPNTAGGPPTGNLQPPLPAASAAATAAGRAAAASHAAATATPQAAPAIAAATYAATGNPNTASARLTSSNNAQTVSRLVPAPVPAAQAMTSRPIQAGNTQTQPAQTSPAAPANPSQANNTRLHMPNNTGRSLPEEHITAMREKIRQQQQQQLQQRKGVKECEIDLTSDNEDDGPAAQSAPAAATQHRSDANAQTVAATAATATRTPALAAAGTSPAGTGNDTRPPVSGRTTSSMAPAQYQALVAAAAAGTKTASGSASQPPPAATQPLNAPGPAPATTAAGLVPGNAARRHLLKSVQPPGVDAQQNNDMFAIQRRLMSQMDMSNKQPVVAAGLQGGQSQPTSQPAQTSLQQTQRVAPSQSMPRVAAQTAQAAQPMQATAASVQGIQPQTQAAAARGSPSAVHGGVGTDARMNSPAAGQTSPAAAAAQTPVNQSKSTKNKTAGLVKVNVRQPMDVIEIDLDESPSPSLQADNASDGESLDVNDVCDQAPSEPKTHTPEMTPVKTNIKTTSDHIDASNRESPPPKQPPVDGPDIKHDAAPPAAKGEGSVAVVQVDSKHNVSGQKRACSEEPSAGHTDKPRANKRNGLMREMCALLNSTHLNMTRERPPTKEAGPILRSEVRGPDKEKDQKFSGPTSKPPLAPLHPDKDKAAKDAIKSKKQTCSQPTSPVRPEYVQSVLAHALRQQSIKSGGTLDDSNNNKESAGQETSSVPATAAQVASPFAAAQVFMSSHRDNILSNQMPDPETAKTVAEGPSRRSSARDDDCDIDICPNQPLAQDDFDYLMQMDTMCAAMEDAGPDWRIPKEDAVQRCIHLSHPLGRPREVLGLRMTPMMYQCQKALLDKVIQRLHRKPQHSNNPDTTKDQLMKLIVPNQREVSKLVVGKVTHNGDIDLNSKQLKEYEHYHESLQNQLATRIMETVAAALNKDVKALTILDVLKNLPTRLPTHQTFEEYTVGSDDPREGLRGQLGVKVSAHVKAGQLIGVYDGFAMLESEYNHFQETPPCCVINDMMETVDNLIEKEQQEISLPGPLSHNLEKLFYIAEDYTEGLVEKLLNQCSVVSGGGGSDVGSNKQQGNKKSAGRSSSKVMVSQQATPDADADSPNTAPDADSDDGEDDNGDGDQPQHDTNNGTSNSKPTTTNTTSKPAQPQAKKKGRRRKQNGGHQAQEGKQVSGNSRKHRTLHSLDAVASCQAIKEVLLDALKDRLRIDWDKLIWQKSYAVDVPSELEANASVREQVLMFLSFFSAWTCDVFGADVDLNEQMGDDCDTSMLEILEKVQPDLEGLKHMQLVQQNGAASNMTVTAHPLHRNVVSLINDPATVFPDSSNRDALKQYGQDGDNASCCQIVIQVAGWPFPCMVTCKDIKKGQPASYCYGLPYWNAVCKMRKKLDQSRGMLKSTIAGQLATMGAMPSQRLNFPYAGGSFASGAYADRAASQQLPQGSAASQDMSRRLSRPASTQVLPAVGSAAAGLDQFEGEGSRMRTSPEPNDAGGDPVDDAGVDTVSRQQSGVAKGGGGGDGKVAKKNHKIQGRGSSGHGSDACGSCAASAAPTTAIEATQDLNRPTNKEHKDVSGTVAVNAVMGSEDVEESSKENNDGTHNVKLVSSSKQSEVAGGDVGSNAPDGAESKVTSALQTSMDLQHNGQQQQGTQHVEIQHAHLHVKNLHVYSPTQLTTAIHLQNCSIDPATQQVSHMDGRQPSVAAPQATLHVAGFPNVTTGLPVPTQSLPDSTVMPACPLSSHGVQHMQTSATSAPAPSIAQPAPSLTAFHQHVIPQPSYQPGASIVHTQHTGPAAQPGYQPGHHVLPSVTHPAATYSATIMPLSTHPGPGLSQSAPTQPTTTYAINTLQQYQQAAPGAVSHMQQSSTTYISSLAAAAAGGVAEQPSLSTRIPLSKYPATSSGVNIANAATSAGAATGLWGTRDVAGFTSGRAAGPSMSTAGGLSTGSGLQTVHAGAAHGKTSVPTSRARFLLGAKPATPAVSNLVKS